MKFTELGLEPQLLDVITKIGYQDCTPIQEKAIPHILSGHDIAGLSQTGTGKTATFVIPLINRILKAQQDGQWHNRYYNLVLVPTRELAEQVEQSIKKFGADLQIKSASIYGGSSYEKQKAEIATGVDFIVATPGRLIDLYKEHIIDLKQVKAIIFDEADRMFDMGFKDDMRYILQRVPQDRQFLVFSATLNFEVLNVAYAVGANPIEIAISRDHAKAENVKDQIFHVGSNDKPQHLLSLIKIHNPQLAIIFSNYKHHIDRIVNFLNDNHVPAVGISSLLTQNQRNRVIEQFKNPKGQMILVATDVAARGLDITGVDIVINYDLPNDAESYVHRIGRTGRAGLTGLAFSMVGDKDVEALTRIEEYLKHKVEAGWLDDTQLVKDFVPVREVREEKPYKASFKREGGFRKDRPQKTGGPRRDHRGPPREDRRDDRQDQRKDRPHSAHQGEKKAFPKKDFKPKGPRGENKDHAHSSHNGNGQHKPKDQKYKNNYQHKDRPKHRPYVPGKVTKPKTVGEKISGFFKKLFS